MVSLAPDLRVEGIQAAVAACDAAGRRRLHLANGEYAWPRNLVALLDEMKVHGVPDAQILAVGDALRDAAYKTVYVGTGEPTATAGEAFALEAVAEGEANRDVARLIDAPHDEHLLRQAVRSLSWHETMLGHAKRVLLRNIHRRQAAAR
jgi:hypothetical protein